jgi:WD40 repeat protein
MEIHRLAGHTNFIRCLAFSRDGQRLVSASNGLGIDHELFLWDTATGKLHERSDPRGLVNGLAFSSDGATLFAAAGRVLRRFEPGKAELAALEHVDELHCLAVSPDEGLLAVGGGHRHGPSLNDVQIWEQSSGKLLRTLSG